MFRITFDRRKRDRTLKERKLKFEDAAKVFQGYTLDEIDARLDYGEERWITVGALRNKVVVIVWTPVDAETRRVISVRAADGEEQENYWRRLAEEGPLD
ncbi:MAG: BrnT family toxin [Hyphomonadaceae bacterium]|nr:BrnT family toxin [Hyphomonadaceae bacterium]